MLILDLHPAAPATPAPSRDFPAANPESPQTNTSAPPTFCHTFDLAKRLTPPTGATVNHIPISTQNTTSLFVPILQNLQAQLASSPPHTIHRLVVPSLLSPALYPLVSSHPYCVLQFLHGLRGLLRQYSSRLVALFTLPLSLYPRTSGIVRWMELLSDGVLELTPFPHDDISSSGAATAKEDRPQGMLKAHRWPVFHEKGGGGGGGSGMGDDLAFTVSRRKFVIAKFSLPPLEGDREGQEGVSLGTEEKAAERPKTEDLDF